MFAKPEPFGGLKFFTIEKTSVPNLDEVYLDAYETEGWQAIQRNMFFRELSLSKVDDNHSFSVWLVKLFDIGFCRVPKLCNLISNTLTLGRSYLC